VSARCLSSLEPLPAEGYSAAAQRRLAGDDDRPFPHRVGHRRSDLLTYLLTVVDRMSVSGVQEKVSLKLVAGALEPTDIGGEFILKAVGAQLPWFVEDVPANEHVSMLVAERVFGIEVPPCGLVRLADDELAYLVKRFDAPRGVKVLQEDFSQLMERTATSHGAHFKYESSYEEVGETLRRFNQDPLQVERLFVRILFSYAISNGDAHLKNFSLFRPDPAGPHVLTPAYDLLCTSLHIPTEARLALELFKDGYVTPAFERYGFETFACFLELARRFGILEHRARELMRPFVEAQPMLEDLVGRSFLSDAAKVDYLVRYRDRLAALRIGAA
jgi:serine/threonine-protein kinase HipA